MYRIGTVLKKTESRHVEYKTGGGNYPFSTLPAHVRRYGSAFLNSSGGILYVGVSDDGKYESKCSQPHSVLPIGVVLGIHLPRYSQKEDIRHAVQSEFKKFTPTVSEDLYECVCNVQLILYYYNCTLCRLKFVQCNRPNYYILQLSVRSGDPSEIYADGENKVGHLLVLLTF